MWFSSLYNCLFLLGFFFLLLKGKRFRWVRWNPIIPQIPKEAKHIFWFHAVSVGETHGIVPLVEWVKEQTPDAFILISSVTKTGHATAKNVLSLADAHLFLPYDLSWIVKPFVKKIGPTVVFLSETDFWPHFLQACKNVQAEVVVVNGKMSEKSMRRFARFPWWANKTFENIDHVCVQNQAYKERFEAAGVHREKMTVTGNLKLVNPPQKMTEREKGEWKRRLGILPGAVVLTAGSTHASEEEWLLDAIPSEKCKFLLVPRHPERFEEVAHLLECKGIAYSRLSKDPVCDESVVLIDAMGELCRCYQVSDLAVVGGSFVERVGGHNIIEPCHFGVPVLFGPHMHTQRDLRKQVLQAKAGEEVALSELSVTLHDWLNDPEKCQQCGQNGYAMTQSLQQGENSPLKQTIALLFGCAKSGALLECLSLTRGGAGVSSLGS